MESSYVKKNSFYEFYNNQNVLPVSQSLENLDEFIFRRDFLYTSLGIPLRTLEGRKIIEFGPGGGFNAVATSHYNPYSYTFVDASQNSLKQLQVHNEKRLFNAQSICIEDSDIFDYSDKKQFDLVVVEGVIPGQNQPAKLLQHVSSFAKEGGFLIVTSTTSVSLLSEICRRVLRIRLNDGVSDFSEKAKITAEFFSSHLSTLDTSTRPPIDWAIDVILHDWHKDNYIFTLKDTIETIEDHFDFYNSSPRFLIDDRWYKKVTRGTANINTLVLDQYPIFCSALLDYRISLNEIKSREFPKEIDNLCMIACELHNDMINQNNYDLIDDFMQILHKIEDCLPSAFDITRLSIENFRTDFSTFLQDPTSHCFQDFKKWWGRGQQYLSFIKRTKY